MTLRQVLEVLWRRKLLVIATLILAVAAAMAYMEYSVKTYESMAIVKLSAAASASGDTKSTYGGIELDTDTDAITSTLVLDPAARELGVTDTAALSANLKVDVTKGVRTNKVNIHAVGNSPEQSQARANAVASGYVAYLEDQVSLGKERLLDDKAATAKQVRQFQKELNRDKRNSVLQTYLAQAITRLGQTQGQLDQLDVAGKPATIQKQATLGSSNSIAPRTILAIGVLSGLLAGAGVALVREQFDERLRSSKEIESATGEPILAEIAVDRRRRKGDLSLPTATHRATAFNESIRTLRTSLQVVATSRAVVVVTSPEPGDGKSFITANLAVSMALAGRSVIVIGGDLRSGRIGEYFEARADAKGFADAIASDADTMNLEDLLLPTKHENLRLLPSGSTMAEPADLLAAESLALVIARLRDMADVVLIDTPPALALADAAIIARHADGVVVLCTIGRTQRESLVATVRMLKANATHVYGVVSNRSRLNMPKWYLGASGVWKSRLPVQTPSRLEDATHQQGPTLLGDQIAHDSQLQVAAEPVADDTAHQWVNEGAAAWYADSPEGEDEARADEGEQEAESLTIEAQAALAEQAVEEDQANNWQQAVEEDQANNWQQAIEAGQVADAEEVVEAEQATGAEQGIEAEQVVDAEEVVDAEQATGAEQGIEAEQVVDAEDVVDAEQAVEVEQATSATSAEQVVDVEEVVYADQAVEAEQAASAEEGIEAEQATSAEEGIEAEQAIDAEQLGGEVQANNGHQAPSAAEVAEPAAGQTTVGWEPYPFKSPTFFELDSPLDLDWDGDLVDDDLQSERSLSSLGVTDETEVLSDELPLTTTEGSPGHGPADQVNGEEDREPAPEARAGARP